MSLHLVSPRTDDSLCGQRLPTRDRHIPNSSLFHFIRFFNIQNKVQVKKKKFISLYNVLFFNKETSKIHLASYTPDNHFPTDVTSQASRCSIAISLENFQTNDIP